MDAATIDTDPGADRDPDPDGNADIDLKLWVTEGVGVDVLTFSNGAHLRIGDPVRSCLQISHLSRPTTTTEGALDGIEDFLSRCLDEVRGARRRLQGWKVCAKCQGHGETATADPQQTETCSACGGKGEVHPSSEAADQ